MSILTDKLGVYTCTVKKGVVNWKRGTRTVDISAASVLEYIHQIGWQRKDVELISYLKNDVTTEITEYFESMTKQALEQSTPTTGVIYESERDYILAKCKEHGFRFSVRGDKIWRKMPNGKETICTSTDVIVWLEADLDKYNAYSGEEARTFKIGTIKATLDTMLQDAEHLCKSELQDKLLFDPSKSDITVRWLKNLHHVMHIAESQDLWVMLMSHVMWLVKRRLNGLTVRSDLWISIFGGQNVGKTYTFKECIFKPLNDFYIETELSKIEDIDREIEKFTNNFVINFDEIALGNSGQDDHGYRVSDKMLQNIKSILTRQEIMTRVMGVQKQMKKDKTFVAVSSANTHLYDVIFDKTGMRRFFEFNTNATKQYDNDLIAKLADMSTDAWQGIDEGLPKGYWDQSSELGQDVFRIQKTYRPKNNVTEWITGETVKHSDTNTVDVKHAYTSYKAYCQSMGLKAYSMPAFRDILDYYYPVHEDGTVAITIGKVMQPINSVTSASQPIDDVWSKM